MKQIKYSLGGRSVTLGYSEENLLVAKQEADNGECTIEDDGITEELTHGQRITDLEEAMDLLLSGVTECNQN